MPYSLRSSGRPAPTAQPRPISSPWASSHAPSSSRSAAVRAMRGSTCSMAPPGSASGSGRSGVASAFPAPVGAAGPRPPSRSRLSWSPPRVSWLRVVEAGRRDARCRQTVDQRSELELAEALGHRAAVVSAGPRLLEVQLDRQVGHDAADLARHEGRLAMLGQPVAHLALHLVEALVDRRPASRTAGGG